MQWQQNGLPYILEGIWHELHSSRNVPGAAFLVALVPCPSPSLLPVLLNSVL